jgi:hypothetical protein
MSLIGKNLPVSLDRIANSFIVRELPLTSASLNSQISWTGTNKRAAQMQQSS